MKTNDVIDEVQSFINHICHTAIYVWNNCQVNDPDCSERHMIRQTWEIAFDTYVKNDGTTLDWDTDEDTYGDIFDIVVDKVKKIFDHYDKTLAD